MKNATSNLKLLGINDKRTNEVMHRIQKAAILRTINVCETAMNMLFREKDKIFAVCLQPVSTAL